MRRRGILSLHDADEFAVHFCEIHPEQILEIDWFVSYDGRGKFAWGEEIESLDQAGAKHLHYLRLLLFDRSIPFLIDH